MNPKIQPYHIFENTETAFASKTNAALKKAYRLFYFINHQPWVKAGTRLTTIALKLKLPIHWILKKTVFHQFCGGESMEDCQKVMQQLATFGIGTILDYSVEGQKTEKGLEKTAQEIIKTIEFAAQHRDNVPFAVFKTTGIISLEILEKKQSNIPLHSSETQAWQQGYQRFARICETAFQHQVRLLIDAEETWIQEVIDELVYEMMSKYNQQQAIIYNTYQLYTREALPHLQSAFQKAQEVGYFLGAKLVRGAYMEKERLRAEKLAYSDPIHPNKESTDTDFNLALAFCVMHYSQIALCVGSHNEYSHLYLMELMQKQAIPTHHPHFYFAQLYGMSDHISYNLAKEGYQVAKYLPYGALKEVIPYLFRRAEENTSVAGQSSRELMLIKKELKRRKNQNIASKIVASA
jgi:proline dehydrogenase